MRYHSKKILKKTLFSYIEEYISGDNLFTEGIPLKYVPIVFYAFSLCIAYIFNNYNNGHLMNKERILNDQILSLKTEYMVLKSEYDILKLQSNIISQSNTYGLKKSNIPPKIIHLEK